MWEQLKRIVKPRSAIVLTATQPFTSRLVSSNYEMFRYEWIWEKEQGVNFQLAKIQPLKISESVLVFGKMSPFYYPQGLEDVNILKSNSKKAGSIGSISILSKQYIQTTSNYPKNIIRFNREVGHHPTQKPVALFEYLVKTYTQEHEIVLDMTCGSGKTGVERVKVQEQNTDVIAEQIQKLVGSYGVSSMTKADIYDVLNVVSACYESADIRGMDKPLITFKVPNRLRKAG